MKYTFCIKRLDNMPGGAERVFTEVVNYLAGKGHRVTVITFDNLNARAFYPLCAGVKVKNLGIGDSSKPARFIETLLRIYNLRQAVLRDAPDVVVGFNHSMFLLLALAFRQRSFKLIGSEHIVPDHYSTRPLQKYLYYLLVSRLDLVTVVSQQVRDSFSSRVKSKMRVIFNPVTSSLNRLGDQKSRHSTILNVGRLVDQKDHKTLLAAFAIVIKKFPEWRLQIFGEGPLEHRLKQQSRELGIEKNIAWMGVTGDLAPYYAHASLFCLSSKYESFGLVAAEAMSSRLPVVAFASCPGVNSLIQNSETGLLVQESPNRIVALAEALVCLIEDANLRKKLGNAGSERIRNYFSIDVIGSEWEQMLKEICAPMSRD